MVNGRRLNIPRDGGIITKPTKVSFGADGSGSSFAIIPMPDGLTIPLTVKDGEIVVELPLGRSIATKFTEGQGDHSYSKKLYDMANSEVNKFIVDNLKTGGLLNKKR